MAVARHLVRPTRGSPLPVLSVRAGPRRLFGLAPTGGCRAAPVTGTRGGLLPHRFTLTCLAAGGLFSVALSIASRRPGVTWQSALGARTFLESRRTRDHRTPRPEYSRRPARAPHDPPARHGP